MTDLPRDAACRNCRRPFPAGELDASGWCEKCRAVVIRRATVAAWIAAALVATATAVLLLSLVDVDPRFLIVWIVLLLAVSLAAFKVAQRVAFEAIRSRGVPPPKD